MILVGITLLLAVAFLSYAVHELPKAQEAEDLQLKRLIARQEKLIAELQHEIELSEQLLKELHSVDNTKPDNHDH